MEEDFLYKNALYFKKNILGKSFILQSENYILVINSAKQDFAHLVGKQYSNLSISQMSSKDFYKKVINKEITYNQLLDIDPKKRKKELTWIKNKNISFIQLFENFMNQINLKLYNNKKIFTHVDMDFFHKDIIHTISILGIIGNNYNNYFSFLTIMSNDEHLWILEKCKSIKIHKVHVVSSYNLNEKIKEIALPIYPSKRNTYNLDNNIFQKNKSFLKELKSKDFNYINKKLEHHLFIKKGAYGKKSVQIIKNNTILDKGYKLDLKKYCSLDDIVNDLNHKFN